MPDRLRIIVTGLAATYPLGGVFWDYFQYALGLHKLGHDVLYLEDTGQWVYDPTLQTMTEDAGRNAKTLAGWIGKLEPQLAERWHVRDAGDRTFGRSPAFVADFCKTADLFIHLSATCWMRDEYFAVRRVALIDSDPMFTQSAVPAYLDGTIDDFSRHQVETLRRHHVFFSFGENIGSPDCLVPTALFDWKPTRQPIVMDCFTDRVPVANRRRLLTTVGSWEATGKGPLVNGVQYRGKSVEFAKFVDLPRRCPVPIEAAVSGKAPRDELRAAGWLLRDGYDVSHDPWVYRDHLASSLAEWSVAKHAYAAPRTGWFSCRTACYLALGVPAVVQDTGFSRCVPTGDGLFAFDTLDEALAGVEAILLNPEHHARAAVDLARDQFDSGKVLGHLIDRAMA